jgi:hypothetical protein
MHAPNVRGFALFIDGSYSACNSAWYQVGEVPVCTELCHLRRGGDSRILPRVMTGAPVRVSDPHSKGWRDAGADLGGRSPIHSHNHSAIQVSTSPLCAKFLIRRVPSPVILLANDWLRIGHDPTLANETLRVYRQDSGELYIS